MSTPQKTRLHWVYLGVRMASVLWALLLLLMMAFIVLLSGLEDCLLGGSCVHWQDIGVTRVMIWLHVLVAAVLLVPHSLLRRGGQTVLVLWLFLSALALLIAGVFILEGDAAAWLLWLPSPAVAVVNGLLLRHFSRGQAA
ncbi:hypothetical protein L1281_001699 [Neisseria sp. HSC-16F19]|nr:hypothetical protein [Neisseria sp. HSC-16F19]MCP2041105.1 hypothetical protein [Neisseria sp. HSC-16F19]